MNRPNPKSQPFRDFMSGLVFVPVLHVVFIVASMFLMIIVPYFLILALGISLSQFLYLVPLMLVYQRQGRLEVVKGMLVAAFLTILLSGACATIITPPEHAWANSVRDDTLVLTGLSMVTLIVTAVYCLNHRSRSK